MQSAYNQSGVVNKIIQIDNRTSYHAEITPKNVFGVSNNAGPQVLEEKFEEKISERLS